jgi:hypothetical protein
MPSRRAFLGLLAAAALDPDRALWVPGAKLISIPRPRSPYAFPDFPVFPSQRVFFLDPGVVSWSAEGVYRWDGERVELISYKLVEVDA